MARKKKEKKGLPPAMWIVTFSDLVTLMLTFFVLLLSMSSMDRSFITRVTVFTQDLGFLTYRGSGRIPTRIKFIHKIIERPQDILLKQNRLKDLLFPDDVLPPEMDRAELLENLEVLERPEGVALVLSDDLLFPSGSSELTQGAQAVLDQLALVMQYSAAAVNVAGYTDTVGGRSAGNFLLAGERAMSVLSYFLQQGLHESRFSVSAYGPELPLATPADYEAESIEQMTAEEIEAMRAKNRRVEILLKTTPTLGGYS